MALRLRRTYWQPSESPVTRWAHFRLSCLFDGSLSDLRVGINPPYRLGEPALDLSARELPVPARMNEPPHLSVRPGRPGEDLHPFEPSHQCRPYSWYCNSWYSKS